MPLDTREQVTSLSPVFLNGRNYVAVGTSLFSEDENDEYSHGAGMIYAREGRLHLIEPRRDGGWQIGVKTTVETVGAVHDVTTIHGFLAVAAGNKVSAR
jgi:DNA damage-binding protein 1